MKQSKKRFIIITIAICVIVLAGCKNIRFDIIGKDKDPIHKTTDSQEKNSTLDNKEEDKEVENQIKATEDIKTVDTDSEIKDETSKVIAPAAKIELMIYSVNNNGDIETVIAAIPEEEAITPQLIVDTVTSSMADNSLIVGIDRVTTKDDTVIVSFYKDQPPVSNVGGGYETAILDAIAQSLTENLNDYSKIIYRVEGEAYVSGHIELDLDEVYFTK